MSHRAPPSARRTPFHLLEVGLHAIEKLRPVVAKLERRDPNLADQLRRALTAAPLLAAEGNRARKNNRTAKLEAAGAEAAEALTALRVAMAWNYVTWAEIEPGIDHLDHFQAIVRRLTSWAVVTLAGFVVARDRRSPSTVAIAGQPSQSPSPSRPLSPSRSPIAIAIAVALAVAVAVALAVAIALAVVVALAVAMLPRM
jgi:four helix bundle protein